eukprot:s640_g5.t4
MLSATRLRTPCSSLLLCSCLAASETLELRDVGKFLDPVFVPDFFLDAAPAAEVFGALTDDPPSGQGYVASVLDSLQLPPRMAPVLLWETGLLLQHLASKEVSQVIVDVGAHEWSRFLPRLREDPKAWLILLEPGRKAFLMLYRRLKMNYADVIDRVVALPVALTWEPGRLWGFRVLHTSNVMEGECNSLLEPNDQFPVPCIDRGPEEIVPVMSLDVLLELLLHDASFSKGHSQDNAAASHKEGPPIRIKLDAQGADFSIFSVLESTEALLERVAEVQLEVSDPMYHLQPSRHDIMVGMRRLGFQLDWQKQEIHDGGVHQVRCGCRLVTENPRTEDCFFVRAADWTHGRMLELFLRRPDESVRLSEGTGMSISLQYGRHMQEHINACERDAGARLEEQDDEMGAGGLACLYRIAGWPLRQAALSTALLWEMIWNSKQQADRGTLVVNYAQVILAMWDLLVFGGPDHDSAWDELHDAGVAHLMFTVLVEASCLLFPDLCSTDCIDVPSETAEESTPGHATPCASLRDCRTVFHDANPKTVIKTPGSEKLSGNCLLPRPSFRIHGSDCEHFFLEVTGARAFRVPVFRRAQRLTRPPCFPSHWRLELDRTSTFPTVDSGGYNVTVISVDASHCSLEISMIAWDLDAADMLSFHRDIWDRAERGRENIDAADFRIPTEGNLWDFDCQFETPSGTLRTRGDVVSYPILSELPHTQEAPVLIVHCEAPGGRLASPPSSVLLTRSVRSIPDMPSIQLEVPLRENQRKKVRTALCNSQVWGSHSLKQLAPDLMEFWFLYYSENLKIDEIYVYDLDGSFESMLIVQELRASGRVVYDPFFSSIPPLKDIFALAGHKTSTAHLAQTLVQHHCWQQARQTADWVISLNHGWDMFLFSPAGGTLQDLLEELPPDQVTRVLGVRYGEHDSVDSDAQATPNVNVFLRFPYHVDPGVRPEKNSTEELVIIAKPSLIANIALSAVVVRQDAPLRSNLLEHPLPCPKGKSREFAGPMMHKARQLDVEKWRANHYVQALGGRKVLYRSEEQMVELRNFSIFDAAAVQLGHELQDRWRHRLS